MSRNARIERAIGVVEWRDLRELTPLERVVGLSISVPWIVFAWWFAANEAAVLAFACWFLFFGAGLRQAHDGFHRNLGLTSRGTDLVIVLLSAIMMMPLHAVKSSHRLHHVDPLGASDVEAYSARMSCWKAILSGPVFSWRLIRHGLGSNDCTTAGLTRFELALILVTSCAAIGIDYAPFRMHVLAMALGNCLTGFFAVWIVHRGCDPRGIFARTERSVWLDVVTFDLLYHFEHHLFPKVPSCHLRELGRRLERQLPEVHGYRVIDRRAGDLRAAAARTKVSAESNPGRLGVECHR